MSMGIVPLAVILVIMAAALVFHQIYINKIYTNLKGSKESFRMADLKKSLEMPQGSNFNTFMIASWMLFFVALAFLFFQTPGISPLYYFQAIWIASSDYGLLVFGLAIMFVTSILAFSIPTVYRYYITSRGIKMLMVYFVPLLLMISIGISIWLGTIYPDADENHWNLIWDLGYVTLLASLIFLVTPIIGGLWEVAK